MGLSQVTVQKESGRGAPQVQARPGTRRAPSVPSTEAAAEEAPTPPRPRARRAPPAVGRQRARLFPPRAAPCAPAPSAISVEPWPPFSRRLCVWLAAWLGSCERTFVRFGNGRVGNGAGEEVCVGGRRAPCGPCRGRAGTPRRPLPESVCRYPPPPHRTHPSCRFPGGSGGENGEKGARRLGRHGGRRVTTPEGSGRRRGMGRTPRAPRWPCPLPEPFRSVTWDPDPGERDERAGRRGRPGGGGDPGGEGDRPPVPAGCP